MINVIYFFFEKQIYSFSFCLFTMSNFIDRDIYDITTYSDKELLDIYDFNGKQFSENHFGTDITKNPEIYHRNVLDVFFTYL